MPLHFKASTHRNFINGLHISCSKYLKKSTILSMYEIRLRNCVTLTYIFKTRLVADDFLQNGKKPIRNGCNRICKRRTCPLSRRMTLLRRKKRERNAK